MSSTKRFLEIDIAKGIGIILVLIGHLQVPSILKNYLYSFHMPLFFFLGGAIYYSTSNNNGKKLKLIILYIIFGLFFTILNFAKYNEVRLDLLFDIIKSNPISIYNIEWFGVFWFVLSYIFVSRLVRVGIFSKLSFSFVIFVVFYFISLSKVGREFLLLVPFCISPALMLLFYYNMGKIYNKVVEIYSLNFFLILIVVYFLSNYYISDLYGGFDSKIYNFGAVYFGVDLFSLLFVSIVGIVLCLYFSVFIRNECPKLSLFFSHFGSNSLRYFIWHLFVFSLVHSGMYRITMNESYSETMFFQATKLIVSIFIIYVGIVVYNKIKFQVKGANGL